MADFEKNSGGYGSMFTFMSSLDKTSVLCRQETLQGVFNCLHRVYNQCARTREGADTLGLIMDPNRWQKAIKLICDNIGYLREHARCETMAQPEFQQCTVEEKEAFQTKLISLQERLMDPDTQLSQAQILEAKADIGCLFTMKILNCLRMPYEKYCPQPISNLLMNIIENFMPPRCSKSESAYPPSENVQTGPSYQTGPAGKPGPVPPDDNTYDNHDNENNNNDISNGDFVRQDVIVGTHRERDDIKGDDDDSGDMFEDIEQDRAENIVVGNPGEAAEAVRSDKDGTVGAHGAASKVGSLMAVLVSILAMTLGRKA
ncbi:hypothetical protein PoB_001090700 [Plakobranchus ocellatus]|uniref:Secreted protein n=1 Tax=Plakobranchus ocellatus TaxID=259542 RepID=A0AAV3YPN7_9GAST|nr:hypothetical protein PoB_001090700 [Plakobranchus ocellatus]